MEYKHNNYP